MLVQSSAGDQMHEIVCAQCQVGGWGVQYSALGVFAIPSVLVASVHICLTFGPFVCIMLISFENALDKPSNCAM